ncbi:PQQ-dependent sugar dehydrogenase [Steroidobacter agaridevorans]|uniref:PQQ-dependent sugar dehydrogenase n=1 Tax=Steroidobacter agaridevorans TaxID=2695856 RepID=UPI00137A3E24|nr:PQQ-dependent sugar dehydrogenase [Steroidobacter agaridevorans]
MTETLNYLPMATAENLAGAAKILCLHAVEAYLLLGIFGVSRAEDLSVGAPAETMVRTSGGAQTYWVEQLAEGLNFPSSMAWLPNGDILITERMGNLRVMHKGKLDPQPVPGTPPSYHSVYDGIRDIALDPDFKNNRLLYLYLSEGTFESRRAAVYQARLDRGGLANPRRIFLSSEAVGGASVSIVSRMTLLKDGTLLFGVAEDHAQARAQDLHSHMGKILRIHRDGSIPVDNPFINTPGALPEIWSYGHRIPMGFYQDPSTGELWEIEPGPRGGDELNLLKAGANYGWAKASWGFAYLNKGLEAPVQSGPGIEDPVYVWMPSVTPAGITRYVGGVFPPWDGDLFIGNLSGKALLRLKISDRQVVVQERMLHDLDERIRDVRLGPDGYLYLLTDHQNGRVLKLRSGYPAESDQARVARKLGQPMAIPGPGLPKGGEEQLALMQPGDFAQGRQEFLERCAGCHSISPSISGGELGPDLENVYDSFMGRKRGYEYSTSMSGRALIWDFATLNQFLAAPQHLAPGTKMTAPPVTDAQTRRNIIGFLKQQSSSH